MARRRNFGGFSWKRLTGVTRAKQRFSRATGIPLSRSGRQRKLGKAAGGCLLSLLIVAVLGLSPVYGQYILNTETGKVHLPNCRTIQPGNEVGKNIVQGGANFVPVATTEGYDPCGVCKPTGRSVPAVRPATPATVKPVPAPATPSGFTPGAGSWKPGQNTPVIPAPAARVTPQPAEKTPLQWGWVKVERVVDGDTFVLENGKTVRLIGADTPETVKPNTPVQPFGKLASDYTKEIIRLAENWVYLEEDGDTEDRYGRQLAMVWLQVPLPTDPNESKTFLLNDMLIKLGLAKAQTQYHYSQKMKDKFIQSEKDAREYRVRIWSTAL